MVREILLRRKQHIFRVLMRQVASDPHRSGMGILILFLSLSQILLLLPKKMVRAPQKTVRLTRRLSLPTTLKAEEFRKVAHSSTILGPGGRLGMVVTFQVEVTLGWAREVSAQGISAANLERAAEQALAAGRLIKARSISIHGAAPNRGGQRLLRLPFLRPLLTSLLLAVSSAPIPIPMYRACRPGRARPMPCRGRERPILCLGRPSPSRCRVRGRTPTRCHLPL